MKRLLKSSNFWNAVLGSGVAITAFYITGNDTISLAILGLFAGRTIATGSKDFVRAQQNVVFDETEGDFKKAG